MRFEVYTFDRKDNLRFVVIRKFESKSSGDRPTTWKLLVYNLKLKHDDETVQKM